MIIKAFTGISTHGISLLHSTYACEVDKRDGIFHGGMIGLDIMCAILENKTENYYTNKRLELLGHNNEQQRTR